MSKRTMLDIHNDLMCATELVDQDGCGIEEQEEHMLTLRSCPADAVEQIRALEATVKVLATGIREASEAEILEDARKTLRLCNQRVLPIAEDDIAWVRASLGGDSAVKEAASE